MLLFVLAFTLNLSEYFELLLPGFYRRRATDNGDFYQRDYHGILQDGVSDEALHRRRDHPMRATHCAGDRIHDSRGSWCKRHELHTPRRGPLGHRGPARE